MRISDATIRQIHEAVDIVEVVEDYVPLKKKGRYWWALSPFTDEKTPSFTVTPDKGIFKCFSTSKGGDAITFIMEMEGLGYLEALRHLAGKYQIEIEEEASGEDFEEQQTLKDSLYIVLNFASKYYQHLLHTHEEGKSIGLGYFRERGFQPHIVKKFELGYSLNKWDGLKSWATKQQYQEDILEAAGLIVKKEEKCYDRFRGRVMFPIHNLSGKTIGFGARTLKKDDKPKYLNSPESEVYHKSDILYGLFQAKSAIRLQDNCYLVEGYTDVISLHQAGIENVVASSGTSLTDGQIKVIGRFSKNVTMLFDGDKAGLSASMRGVDMILEKNLDVKVVTFPEGEDPDSYVNKVGPAAFKEYLKEKARDFILFKAEIALSGAGNDPVAKANVIREIISSIIKIPDSIKRSVFYRSCSELLSISEETLSREGDKLLLEQQRKEQRRARRTDGGGQVPTPDEAPPITEEGGGFASSSIMPEDGITEAVHFQEQECLRLLIEYGQAESSGGQPLAWRIMQEIAEIPFSDERCHELLQIYRSELETGYLPDSGYLLQKARPDLKTFLANLIAEKDAVSIHWEKHQIFVPGRDEKLSAGVLSTILRLKFRYLQRQCQQVLQQIGQARTDEEETESMMIYSELKKQETALAKHLGIIYS